MTIQEAEKIKIGDVVEVNGLKSRVSSIKSSGIAAPYFRLSAIEEGAETELASYRICTLVSE